MTQFKQIQIRLLKDLKLKTHRYLFDELLPDERMVGIAGPRGVGKTTMMLQYLKENNEETKDALYFSADHIYFSEYRLYDYVEKQFLEEDTKLFFIDEIHRYSGWSQELKNIYDSFPEVRIVFSGSSMLDLIKGEYDLSRRAVLLRMEGVSFREYLAMKDIYHTDPFSFKDIVEKGQEISAELSAIPKISGLFKEYLENGYYPFFLENKKGFSGKLLAIIEKTIHTDIAGFYNLKTQNLAVFKQLLVFLATNPPGQLSIHNLAQSLKVDDKTVSSYLEILADTGLVNSLSYEEGGHRMLRKPVKYYLGNTSLYHTLAQETGYKLETGSVREAFFFSMVKNSGLMPHYSNKGDFVVDDTVFEVGGKSKTRKQIKDIEKAYLVKDDTLIAQKRVVPLYLFGFLY